VDDTKRALCRHCACCDWAIDSRASQRPQIPEVKRLYFAADGSLHVIYEGDEARDGGCLSLAVSCCGGGELSIAHDSR
jgi:hypothetical protein